jgi:protein SCO1/2
MRLLILIRYAAYFCVMALTVVSAAIILGWWQVDGPGRPVRTIGTADIGGPFTLVDHRERLVTEKDFHGKPALVFFGFTFCPDVCPTTLFEISSRLKALGRGAEDLQVLFITIDPERDTSEQLALYLQAFDPRIVGLTGTRNQVNRAIASYKVAVRRVELDGGGYTMDHTASVFMTDRNGQFVGTIDYNEAGETALMKMRRLAQSR